MGTSEYEEDEVDVSTVAASGALSPHDGDWEITWGTLNMVNNNVAMHIELTYADEAGAWALSLPSSDFYPPYDLTTQNGLFTINCRDGKIEYVGSTSGTDGGSAVCEAVYDPWNRG